jgi:hypothetical protein
LLTRIGNQSRNGILLRTGRMCGHAKWRYWERLDRKESTTP